jgi:hypothetical protein
MRWHVTNVHVPGSEPLVPVRLLKVHLLTPKQEPLSPILPQITSGQYTHTRREGEIPEGETMNLMIQCILPKIPPPGTRLKVRLSFEDQFANRHKLGPIVVRPAPEPSPPVSSPKTE